ncbi:MAG: dipeptide epimerase [Thermoflexibacter sp.]|jgi:L-alanine-DL-glutamate epimerase-like enolase superfamily enzyme|nr:dipeptide epimerase [Thermoflexibacter sp.]
MHIHLHQHLLKLKHHFKIARDERSVQPTLIVELSDNQISGYGEATTNTYYGITYQNMSEALLRANEALQSYTFSTPAQLWEDMKDFFASNPFAQCALDEAAYDFYGRKQEKALYQLWGLDLASMPQTNYTIGIDTVENMVKKLQETPWDLYKIKLGTPYDIEIVKELRKYTSAVFRVDANCGWSVEEAINNSHHLKKLGVEFIEQPLKAEEWEGMKEVFNYSALPLIADESCIVETDVRKCIGYFHGINIKLMKCGGITPALRMIQEARKNQMKVMMGCMTESTIGISAIAHIAPMLDYVDMDGPLLITNDIAEGVKLSKEGVIFPKRNGLGTKLIV